MTPSQRVTASKQRKRAAGLIEVRSLWAHPDDVPAIRAHARALHNARIEGVAKRDIPAA